MDGEGQDYGTYTRLSKVRLLKDPLILLKPKWVYTSEISIIEFLFYNVTGSPLHLIRSRLTLIPSFVDFDKTLQTVIFYCKSLVRVPNKELLDSIAPF